MNNHKSDKMQERIDALNKAALNALRTAGLTRARVTEYEKRLKNNESINSLQGDPRIHSRGELQDLSK